MDEARRMGVHHVSAAADLPSRSGSGLTGRWFAVADGVLSLATPAGPGRRKTWVFGLVWSRAERDVPAGPGWLGWPGGA